MTNPLSAAHESSVMARVGNMQVRDTVDVWFLHVGHGDCAIVRHPDDRFTVIDLNLRRSVGKHLADVAFEAAEFKGVVDVTSAFVGGASSSQGGPRRDDPVAFLRWLGASEVYRLVLTHPDMDHLRGLARLRVAFQIKNLWDTHNLKWISPDGLGHDCDGVDWSGYQLLRSGSGGAVVLRPLRGACGNEWTRDGIQVLSPGIEDVVRANLDCAWNGISYVLKLTHGRASVMFTGDAEPQTLEFLASSYGGALRSSVLKAPHHGRWSGWSEVFVKAVAPETTVISSGEKDRKYDCAARYRSVSTVVATHLQGTLGFRLHRNGHVEELVADSPVHVAYGAGQLLRAMSQFLDRGR